MDQPRENEMTRRITEAEYAATPSSYRSVWTTERTDWPQWEEVKSKYMGKRTLMVGENGGSYLLVEGMGLEIVPD